MFHGGEDGRTTVATQSSVLDASVSEWSETAEVEVAAVARRAGVSSGLPYRHFGTRAGLPVALVEDFYCRLGPRRDDARLLAAATLFGGNAMSSLAVRTSQ
ncbi:MAG: hypothetical protein QOE41_3335 [Mycobacterium sp.]|jgi:hypothetical protein|nr:transcriptional regulator [Mycobacterium sp.]MDT5134024.1 hypothetical protein [Mycobacterium sp.]